MIGGFGSLEGEMERRNEERGDVEGGLGEEYEAEALGWQNKVPLGDL